MKSSVAIDLIAIATLTRVSCGIYLPSYVAILMAVAILYHNVIAIAIDIALTNKKLCSSYTQASYEMECLNLWVWS